MRFKIEKYKFNNSGNKIHVDIFIISQWQYLSISSCFCLKKVNYNKYLGL